jgi:prepilin-type N-terminal cleavage/methylation domain-containing protein
MSRGFTLTEILVVIGIFALLSILLVPLGLNYYQREVLNKTDDQLVWVLKEARDNALNQNGGSSFGVYIAAHSFTLFRGISFSQRVAADDLNYSFPSSIAVTGLQEIVFLPNNGTTSTIGKISLSNGQYQRDILINELGVIDY